MNRRWICFIQFIIETSADSEEIIECTATPRFCLSELCTSVAPLFQATVPTMTAASKWMSKPMYQCDYRTSWSKSFHIQDGKHWITICKWIRVACICKVFDYSELFFALIGEDLGDNLIVAWGLRELRKSISFLWMLSLSY